MSASGFRGDSSGKAGTGEAIGRSLLFVGHGAGTNDGLRRSLRRAVTVAEFADSGADADRLLPRCHFDCIVVGVDSPRDPVLAWIDALCSGDGSRCVCVVAPDDPAVAEAARMAGAAAVLPAPLDPRSLQRFLASHALAAIDRVAPKGSRASGMSEAVRVQLVGESAPIRRVRSLVERVAPTSATVLIEGQTGTGKELIARLVHERSGRRGPFVPVNCGAIPPELMETELFGHAKGAFTGAHQQRDGLFVSARGGTLFLDEVSEMRSDLQVKLLRALEESRIRPVGADREVPVDVRIVASAQPGLRERVRQRGFREDLYYRLNVVHVLLPGLRDRPQDIAPLVQHFMQRVADEFGMMPVAFDDAQLAALRAREWPGNVRELRNFIERTVLMGSPPGEDTDGIDASGDPVTGAYPIEWTLERVKQAHIQRVLAHNDGNRSATARQLGVSRKTLERRLGPSEEHDIA